MSEPCVDIAAFLTDETRSQIAQLADIIIPAEPGRPSASEVGVHSRFIDTALSSRTDLIEPLTRVLAAAAANGGAISASIDDGDLSSVIQTFVVCYFMSSSARLAIDYPGQRAMEIAEGETEYYLDDGAVLTDVIERGPIWRSDEP